MTRSRRLEIMGSSADMAAQLRALGALERDTAVRNPDYLARRMVSDFWEGRFQIWLASLNSPFLAMTRWTVEQMTPGSYWFEVARVKHFDSILMEEISKNVSQVVILGAGLDSRAYRFASELRSASVFEVDHPKGAVRKRERLVEVLGGIPTDVTYVSADLMDESLGESLVAKGFDPDASTLVLWVGVSMFLSEGSVAAVLRWVADRPNGSSIAFDYLYSSFFDRKKSFRGARRMRGLMTMGGEPLTFGVEPNELSGLLCRCGLELTSHLGPLEIAERYLRRSNGGFAGQPVGYGGFAHAVPLSRSSVDEGPVG